MPKTPDKKQAPLPDRRRERELQSQGWRLVAGVDEAGMGPLAGPVVAAAVILPDQFESTGIRDSKMIAPPERRQLEGVIRAHSLAEAIGIVGVEEIDRLGIHTAGRLAMRRAVEALEIRPEYLLVDARRIDLDIAQEGPVKGDRHHLCIAAASILAKEERDRIMLDLHDRYPQYGFAQHKGYPTRAHLDGIKRHGSTRIHRRSWLAVREAAGELSATYYELREQIEALKMRTALAPLKRHLEKAATVLPEKELARLNMILRRREKRLD